MSMLCLKERIGSVMIFKENCRWDLHFWLYRFRTHPLLYLHDCNGNTHKIWYTIEFEFLLQTWFLRQIDRQTVEKKLSNILDVVREITRLNGKVHAYRKQFSYEIISSIDYRASRNKRFPLARTVINKKKCLRKKGVIIPTTFCQNLHRHTKHVKDNWATFQTALIGFYWRIKLSAGNMHIYMQKDCGKYVRK